MTRKTRSYESDDAIVDYDVTRCIHAQECVRGLPDVFDAGRRPWIDANRAPVAELVRTIERCPTGALHYRRRDGIEEVAPATNTVRVAADGPLYLTGRLQIALPEGETLQETRAALCRCGHSKDKPFCDNSHLAVGFADDGTIQENRLRAREGGETGTLDVSPAPNGPILIRGPVEIHGSDGRTVHGSSGALCRCGGSATKPFCDGTHKSTGFEAD